VSSDERRSSLLDDDDSTLNVESKPPASDEIGLSEPDPELEFAESPASLR
jgi:hypothetical protein